MTTATDNLPALSSSFTCASILMDQNVMDRLEKVAEMMVTGKCTIPKHLAGSKGDCFAIAMQAAQWGMNPFAVAQKTHLVNGQLGYEAQLVIAVVQATGAIVGEFSYEYQGQGEALECRVGAQLRNKSAITWGEWLRLSSVKTRNSPLWATNPKQQLGYLQAKNWARLHTPGAILGVYSTDELEPAKEVDMGRAEVVGDAPAPEEKKPSELPPWPQDKFDKNLPKWREAVGMGTQTPETILSRIRTIGTVSQAQEKAIQALGERKSQPIEGEFTEVRGAAASGGDTNDDFLRGIEEEEQAMSGSDQ